MSMRALISSIVESVIPKAMVGSGKRLADLRDGRHQIAGVLGLGMLQDVFARALLDDLAAVHDDDAVVLRVLEVDLEPADALLQAPAESAERVVVVRKGTIALDGTPDEVFGAPKSPKTQAFLAKSFENI